jgi:phosphoethanolamine N-methyltransferase
MSDNAVQEYDDDLIAVLETLWGEGFMSPGGVAEVDRYLQGVSLEGCSVLDIGCGLGGVDVHLLRQHRPAKVTGIDIEQDLIDRCQRLAQKYEVDAQAEFVCVEPGPLAFDDASFDVVTSKDSIIHIPDKHALAADVYRVLRPGGWFAASDWLAGYEAGPSAEMQAYLVAEGLDFGLASARRYADALAGAGFVDIDIVDRNDWYRERARQEREQLGGALYDGLASSVGREFLEHEIEVWDKMIVALDQGQLRPTHLRCRKPGITETSIADQDPG